MGQSRTRKKKVKNRGRTALITGSTGSGMGRSTAFRLASEGADIILNYGTYHRSTSALENAETDAKRVADMIHDLGREALIIPADTRDPDQVRAMVDAGVERFGAIDILVNNAGGEGLSTEEAIDAVKRRMLYTIRMEHNHPSLAWEKTIA